nr:guanine nucleotide-binding protein, beta subunit [Tanacetum cinerariifolium]
MGCLSRDWCLSDLRCKLVNYSRCDNGRAESQGIGASVNTYVATTNNTENGEDTNIDKIKDDRTESDGKLNIDFEGDRTEMEDDRTESDGGDNYIF